MRLSKRIALVAALVFAGAAALADAPRRVVSMNLCTDQLAMLIAAPGQLLSVSNLALDRQISAMVDQARGLQVNHGLAEEIYLMRPDLVVAGRFTTHATVEMLQRLGVPVVLFDPAQSLEDVRARLLQMGAALGRETEAKEMATQFDQQLAALRIATDKRPLAALYYANGYTSGDRSLAGQILVTAGFENAAARAGFQSGGTLPLEVLTLLAPDVVITGQRYPGASRSEEIMHHPVVLSLQRGSEKGVLTDRDWVCGTPFVLRAIGDLTRLQQKMVGDRP